MALYDDPRFILSHIRNSFITSDDTGVSELVLIKEDFPLKKSLFSSSLVPTWVLESNDSGCDPDSSELSQSFEIASAEYTLRRRSNTAQRLERMKKERKSQTKVKTIHWRDTVPSSNLRNDANDNFEKRPNKSRPKPSKSVLSEQLEKLPELPSNPFMEYAKFDGNEYTGVSVKKILIYLTMLPSEERDFPLHVTTISSARVQDLIGLICWQFTNKFKEPRLRDSVDCYSLHIAEDDGEVDLDFPSLDPKEMISKFGFNVLALVEKPRSENPQDDQILVTVNIPHGGFSKIPVESKDIPMREILDRTMKRRKGMVKAKGVEYQLEKQSESGIAVDLEATLASLDTLEFCLVRANSKRGEDSTVEEWQPKDRIGFEAPLYQSYTVFHIHKFFPKTEIHLGVSGEKIEIDPLNQSNWVKQQKAVSHDIDTVAACEILKYTGRATFRLTYWSSSSHDYKHHDFEAEGSVASEVCKKISHILEMRCSTTRSDYLARKERKLLRKPSFTLRNK